FVQHPYTISPVLQLFGPVDPAHPDNPPPITDNVLSNFQLLKVGAGASGSFTLSYQGAITDPIQLSGLTAGTIHSDPERLPTIGTHNVVVTGTGPFTIAFKNQDAGLFGNSQTPIPTALVVDDTGTTGGTVTIDATHLGSTSPLDPFLQYDFTAAGT